MSDNLLTTSDSTYNGWRKGASSPKAGGKGLIPLLIVAVYLLLMLHFHRFLLPDQCFLILALLAVALLGKQGGRRFVVDWAPFTLFIIVYDGMRGIADGFFGPIHVSGPYLAERALFGWAGGGEIVPFALQWWKQSLADLRVVDALNAISGFLYAVHFIAPFLFGWYLWHTCRDRRAFYVFAGSLTLLNILALATFFLYPAAPPWYVWENHFASPDLAGLHGGAAAGLIAVDQLLKIPLFSTVYDALNPNYFAAIPSLHGSYPLMIAFFAFGRFRNVLIRGLLVLYVAATWAAACYLNHHYLIDLFIGALYVVAAIALYRSVLGPFLIEPLVFRRNGQSPTSIDDQHGRWRPSVATVAFGSAGLILFVLLLVRARGGW